MAKKSVRTNELRSLRIPGFSAEASLYISPSTYRSNGGWGGANHAVQPMIASWVQSCVKVCGGDPDCLDCCLCIRRGGHPNTCCF